MKGIIVKCLEELVCTKFGKAPWEKSLDDAGFGKTSLILPISDVEDAAVVKLVGSLCKNLNLTLAQVANAFGDFWVNDYSQRIYGQFYAKSATAKDFLLNLDEVHERITESLKNSRPPQFKYEWKDDKTLIIHYQSHRGLIDLAVGLVRGVGKHYRENLRVAKLDSDRIQVVFS